MNQCVPSCDVDENPTPSSFPLRSSSDSGAIDDRMLDYEVAKLTWENRQLWIHGLGWPRVAAKVISSATWEKPRASGTLESIVNQATRLPRRTKPVSDGDDLVPWFDPPRAAPSNTMTMDAMVPCSHYTDEQQSAKIMDSVPRGGVLGTCMACCSTRVESCSGSHMHTQQQEDEAHLSGKRARVAREWSSKDHSVSGSTTFGRDSQHVTVDTCDRELGVAFTSASTDSPENTSSAKKGTKTTTTDDHDSVCHSRQRETGEEDRKKGIRKSSVSTKSRAAAIHNQSERRRRDKINQRMKTLQKLVPNSSKTDKASMLDEVIEYLKQLQAQVQMMNRMNMSSMMLPMAMQQHLRMSMMPPMGMGMGMGMGLDLNAVGHANMAGIPPVLHPSAFMPMTSWDASTSNDQLQGALAAMLMSNPLSTFLASQSQPMTIDAYSRMVAMYQQQLQPPASNSKS